MRFVPRVVVFGMFCLALILAAGCAASEEPTPTAVATAAAEPAAEAETDAVAEVEEGSESGIRTFVVDTSQSSASYIVDEEFLPEMLSKYGIAAGRTDTVGTTPAVEGQLELNLDDTNAPLGDNAFQVDLSQLTSDQRLRDEWVQESGPQFSEYPMAEFVATGVENAPDSYDEGQQAEFQLVGDLTIRDRTQPATFNVAATLEGQQLTGSATADLRMTDFGIEPPNFANTLRVQDEFQVRIDFVALQQ